MIRSRFPFLFLAFIGVTTGIVGGLWRAGLPMPLPPPPLHDNHGALMVCGFLGALISLERAVAFQKRWSYAAPLLAVIGSLLMLSKASSGLAPFLIFFGSLVLILTTLFFLRTSPSLHMTVMAGGALAWLLGNGLWVSRFEINQIVLWWEGFLILTIAGERLELSRILLWQPRPKRLFATFVSIFAVGMLVSLVDFGMGTKIAGAGAVLLAIWLLRYDLARKNLRDPGLRRYMAIALLSGYVWLGIGGIFALFWGGATVGFQYDAMLHAIFIGFVFSMIFAHAPIILPAITGIPIPFRWFFYGNLLVLHLSLLLRIYGDLAAIAELRLWGSLLNAVAIVVFFVSVLLSAKLLPPPEKT